MLQRLAPPDYRARVERGILVRVAAFDWNCPQHITPRYTRSEVEELVGGLTERIAELEARLSARPTAPVAQHGFHSHPLPGDDANGRDPRDD
jgi:hypothetical protein